MQFYFNHKDFPEHVGIEQHKDIKAAQADYCYPGSTITAWFRYKKRRQFIVLSGKAIDRKNWVFKDGTDIGYIESHLSKEFVDNWGKTIDKLQNL